jgi:large-conductance mechanosensitive channel
MDQAAKAFTSEESDTRKLIGRIIIAVIVGEAIWTLIVSVMNNLVVPWLGDVVGQSSGLPASFTQRPYDYPDLFVSILEFCIAAIVAVILNYFFQRPRGGTVKPWKSQVSTPPIESERVVPQAVPFVANPQATSSELPPIPQPKPDPVTRLSPLPVAPATFVSPAKPVTVAPSAPPVATSVAPKPLTDTPKSEPSKKKAKEPYYNIVGDPVPSDED